MSTHGGKDNRIQRLKIRKMRHEQEKDKTTKTNCNHVLKVNVCRIDSYSVLMIVYAYFFCRSFFFVCWLASFEIQIKINFVLFFACHPYIIRPRTNGNDKIIICDQSLKTFWEFRFVSIFIGRYIFV